MFFTTDRVLAKHKRRIYDSRPRLLALPVGFGKFSGRLEGRHTCPDSRPGPRGVRAGYPRGVADWNGEGETVAGIVVMRDGMNALKVIDGVKAKPAEIRPGLPQGVEVVSSYDGSGLIRAS